MPIDFHLSQKEAAVRDAAASFAHNVLKPVRAEYVALQSPNEQFAPSRGATALGHLRAFVSHLHLIDHH